MAIPKIVLIHQNMSKKTTTKLTPKAQHPERTKKFVSSTEEALDCFEDQIGSLDETIWTNAYKMLLNSYKEALTPIWNLARFADVKIILKTIADKEMMSLTDMARKLQPPPVTAKVSKEKRKVPDLETISSTFKDQCPSQNILDNEVCKQIADVFFKLAVAHKAYGEATEGMADLASRITPEQYTVLLAASAMPTIQVVVPGQMVGPLTAPPLQQPETSTAVGCAELIKFAKTQVLPDPNLTELAVADKNSATRVLAAAVFLKLERKYFDETTSHMDASTAFCCNVSQLSKAITGVDYKSGPHHYVPKKQRETAASKHKSGEPEPGPSPAKKQEHLTTSSLHTMTQPDRIISDLDTLSSSCSNDSDLSKGL